MSADLGPGDLAPLQHGPWVWTAMTPIVTEVLVASELEELEVAASTVVARHAPAHVLDALARLTAADFALPTLGSRLVAIRQDLLSGRGYVLLRGLPVERYEPAKTAAIFLGIAAHLGNARPQNAAGHLLGHVTDLGASSADARVRIYQTRERQTFHTDSCDVVGLLCLRQAPRGGDSLLVSAGAIYNEMAQHCPELLARLLRPMAHDRRGEVPPDMGPFFVLPVFSWHDGALTVFYQRQYLESAQRFAEAPRLTALDRAALDRFDSLADDPRFTVQMRLEPGDLQFVHNHTLLHDRTAFSDGPDPARNRHLLRVWLACPGARALPPAFAARYGSVTVGDRGGVAVLGVRPNVSLTPA